MSKELLFMISPAELAWFSGQLKAAEAGDGATACRLGDCYRTGKPLPEDPRRAWRWYLRGAWAGDRDAMNNLGACYHNGYGCEKDMKQAVHWYQRAVEAGSVEALDNLGRCYRDGDGVDRSPDRAAALFREAHAQGHPAAEKRLEEMGLETNPESPPTVPLKTICMLPSRRPAGLGVAPACPRCGSRHVHPGDDDSWWCGGCHRDFPTRAWRCKHPGCLEWAWGEHCKAHEGSAHRDDDA